VYKANIATRATEGWRKILGASMGIVVGFSGLITLPVWLVLAADELAMNSQTAGIISAVQLASAAVSSTLISRLLSRIDLRKAAIIATLFVVAGNIFSAFSGSIAVLIIARILSGMGEGAALASTNAWIARSSAPAKIITIVQVAVALGSVLAFFMLPRLAEGYGSTGVFLAIAGFAVLGAISLPALHASPRTEKDISGSAASGLTVSGFWGVGIFLCLYAAMQGVWAFLGSISDSVGVTLSSTGDLLAVGAVIALAGPIIANRLSIIFGQVATVTLGLLVSATATLLIVASGQIVLFSGAVLAIQLIALYNLTAIFSLLAELDSSGKAAAAAPAAINIGSAIGPLIAGFALSISGFALLGWFSAGLYVLAILFVFASWRQTPAASTS